MTVKHTSFNVAGTNAGFAYDSEPFFPRVLPSSEVQCSFLMSPLLPYSGAHRDPLYVGAVRALGDMWKSQSFTLRELNCVSRLLASVLLVGSVFFSPLNNLISEVCNFYSYVKVRDHISSPKQSNYYLFGGGRIRSCKKF